MHKKHCRLVAQMVYTICFFFLFFSFFEKVSIICFQLKHPIFKSLIPHCNYRIKKKKKKSTHFLPYAFLTFLFQLASRVRFTGILFICIQKRKVTPLQKWSSRIIWGWILGTQFIVFLIAYFCFFLNKNNNKKNVSSDFMV